jgi:cytoskeletal protein CcmA (bactofilin family)
LSNRDQRTPARSRIGATVVVRGTLTSATDVEVAGTLEGDVLHAHALVVLDGARIVGAVAAETITVAGRVDGACRATRVHVAASGAVHGDIACALLSVQDGAHICGRITSDPPSRADEAPALRRPSRTASDLPREVVDDQNATAPSSTDERTDIATDVPDTEAASSAPDAATDEAESSDLASPELQGVDAAVAAYNPSDEAASDDSASDGDLPEDDPDTDASPSHDEPVPLVDGASDARPSRAAARRSDARRGRRT